MESRSTRQGYRRGKTCCPRGVDYLERDCRNECRCFAARGLRSAEYNHLLGDLMVEAVARW